MSLRILPVLLEKHLVPGSFAHAPHHLLDLPAFNTHCRNDTNRARARSSAMVVKAVRLA